MEQHFVTPDVRVSADLVELSRRAAEAATALIGDAVRRRGTCALALSGGHTPRTLYALLASDFRDQIPWPHVHVFWVDERYVPSNDAASNYRMVKETLLDHVPCPRENIHPMPTSFPSPDDAARAYEKTLRDDLDHHDPRFDLVLLGLGEDGHTASLFPGSPALAESARWAVPVEAPVNPRTRLTLTLPAITRAANIYVLAAGSTKVEAVHQALSRSPNPQSCPAAGVRTTSGTLIWWIDQAAAGQSA